jgi:hypothetical protein
MINLVTDNTSESTIRENFEKLAQLIQKNPILAGDFKHLEIFVTNPTSTYKVFHRLGFRPKDVIITYVSTGTATPVFSSFNNESIELNISNASTIRLLIGSVRS